MKRIILTGALSLFGTFALAQEHSGITVSGTGYGKAAINSAEIVGIIQSKAELAGDAMVKFEGAKKRALQVMKDLEIEKLTVKENGVSVGQSGGMDANMMRRMMGAGGDVSVKPEVQVTEKITITLGHIHELSDIDRVNTLARLIDAGTDAGLTFGESNARNLMEMQMGVSKTPNIITYVSNEADKIIDAATKDAIAEARKGATKLAEMTEVKLGKVTAIYQGVNLDEAEEQNPGMAMVYLMMGTMTEKDADGENRLVSTVYQPIPVQVNVTLNFEIE